MSIFNKEINRITANDIMELESQNAVENIRLEFKKRLPSKDNLLKKISSFANTYGGYLVIGVEEDGSGAVRKIRGVEKVPGFKQKIVQWCFDSINPPPHIEVTNEIELKNGKYCYVIYVIQSNQPPHFINGRKGCYIRTDEFSQKFQPKLATQNEILYMSNQRAKALDLRFHILNRAGIRFSKHKKHFGQKEENDRENEKPFFSIGIVPKFPTFVFDYDQLYEIISGHRLEHLSGRIPKGTIKSQFEGYYFDNPRNKGVSYLEIDIHGMVYYAMGNLEIVYNAFSEKEIISGNRLIGWLLFYLKYAQEFYARIGYKGLVHTNIQLMHVRGEEIAFRNRNGRTWQLPGSPYDRNLEFEHSFSSNKLELEMKEVAQEVYREILLSFGSKEVYANKGNYINRYLDIAEHYLGWEGTV